MKKPAKCRATRRAKKQPGRVYREPHTAAELGITCAECGDGRPATYFDYGRVIDGDSRPAFICGAHQPLGRCEKLLVREGAQVKTGAL
jgi:hypothetical protein